MKLSPVLQLFIVAAAIANFVPTKAVRAVSFGEREVDSSKFAIVAAPYRHGHNLMIVEQIPDQKKCWEEVGANPTIIDPLLLNFDFTNACKRSSDSNSYSIRLDGEDYGMDYLLSVIEKDGELNLIGTHRDPEQPELIIGKTHGLADGSLKIDLNPGWSLTKRTYGDKTTEHIYLSYTDSAATESASEITASPVADSSSATRRAKGCNVVGTAR
ncbi:DUF3747 domain-containing protein [Myxosarcina sp. GI1]|uniref:DUF3747 domain-containing protein n=1 Tax=Myxosarcina sp. GI1 TaxID=1541065 RepID=UPI00069029A2|nr:DUF3747 domain-containing protein [Myxosarcina sp. GI1]